MSFVLNHREALEEARPTKKCRVIENAKIYVSDSAVRIVLPSGDVIMDHTSELIAAKQRHFPS
jgi:hypothetical protein